MPDLAEVHAELAAMRRLFTILDRLDPAAQARVLAYLADRYAARPTAEETTDAAA
jgi:hypothetical protein